MKRHTGDLNHFEHDTVAGVRRSGLSASVQHSRTFLVAYIRRATPMAVSAFESWAAGDWKVWMLAAVKTTTAAVRLVLSKNVSAATPLMVFTQDRSPLSSFWCIKESAVVTVTILRGGHSLQMN